LLLFASIPSHIHSEFHSQKTLVLPRISRVDSAAMEYRSGESRREKFCGEFPRLSCTRRIAFEVIDSPGSKEILRRL